MPKITMEADLVKVVAQPIIDCLNAMQQQGISVDEAIAGSLYAIGNALKQRGAIIDLDKSVRSVLTPLAMGYEEQSA